MIDNLLTLEEEITGKLCVLDLIVEEVGLDVLVNNKEPEQIKPAGAFKLTTTFCELLCKRKDRLPAADAVLAIEIMKQNIPIRNLDDKNAD